VRGGALRAAVRDSDRRAEHRLDRLRRAERIPLGLVDGELLQQLERHEVLHPVRNHPLAVAMSLQERAFDFCGARHGRR
jgi:hypothetical protein